MAAPTIWICGLSRSGKSVLADGLAQWLKDRDVPTHVLDGSKVRDEIGGYLGYSREERIKVGRILSSMATLLNNNGIVAIVTAITPYQESRNLCRAAIENYFEVYMRCPVESCIERDDTGTYAKALRGDIRHFVGVDDPFEVPTSADLTIDSGQLDANVCLKQAVDSLEGLVVK